MSKQSLKIEKNVKLEKTKSEKPKPKRKYVRKKKPVEGLGDVVETVTKATGIKKAVDFVFDKLGKDCGCDKRKEKLNELFPIHRVPKCMTNEQYKLWTETRKTITLSKVPRNAVDVIAKLHSELWKHKYHRPCLCEPSKWKKWLNDIEQLYQTYENEKPDPKTE